MEPLPTRPALDPARLADLRAFAGPDSPDLAREVAEIFLELSPGSVQALKDAVDLGRSPDIVFQAHRLRGSAGNVGAVVLCELLQELEDQSKAGTPLSPGLMPQVLEEANRVENAIREEFALGA